MFGFIGGLKAAAWQVLAFLVAVFLIIGAFTWAMNNKPTATAVAGSVGNAVASVVIGTADWVAKQAGGSAAEAGQAATTGPETIWVENKAPAGWHVRQAVLTWNKGLTNVKLRLGPCRDGEQCIHVKQVSDLAPDGGRLTLGRTSSFFGSSPTVKLNGDAIGQVPASFFQVAACHEIGHALGAEHNPSTASCMHATIGKGIPARPDAADYAAVNDRYGR